MRKTFKLTVAALAVLGLASCSSDDFFGNGELGQLQEKRGDILVEVDDLIDPTTLRSALSADDNAWHWQAGDQIRVYDYTLGKYDDYVYDRHVGFEFTPPAGSQRTLPALKDPKYAVFSNAGRNTTTGQLKWNAITDELYAEYTIPESWTWGEELVGEDNSVEAYKSYLPTWGTAGYGEDGYLKAAMHYMTGVLKISLANVPENVATITVAGKVKQGANDETKAVKMTGTYQAVLSKDGAEPTKETVKLDPDSGKNTGDKITVDVSKAKRDQSVLYIPLLEQHYEVFEVQAFAEGNPNAIYTFTKEGFDVKTGKLYTLDIDPFDIPGGDITSINEALKKRIAQEEIVTIKTSKQTSVKQNDFELKIPNMAAKQIVIDVRSFIAEGIQDLHIIEDPDSPGYEGELVINVENTGFTGRYIYVNLPKVRVTFSGQGLTYTYLGNANEQKVYNLNVKQLTIGPAINEKKPTVVAQANVNVEVGDNNTTELEDVIISEGATLTTLTLKGGDETTVKTVAVLGTLVNTLDLATDYETKAVEVIVGEKADLQKGLKTKQQELTIPGQAKIGAGDDKVSILMADGGIVTLNGKAVPALDKDGKATGVNDSVHVAETIKINGEGEFHANGNSYAKTLSAAEISTVQLTSTSQVGTITANVADATLNNQAKASTVTVKNLTLTGSTNVTTATVTANAKIQNNVEHVAVKTKLNMTGAALDEKVNPVLTLTGGYIKALEAKKALVIENEETVQTAIATFTGELYADEDGNTYTSKWCGKTMSATNAKTYAVATDIYTASQFATMEIANGATLKADMDLNGDANHNWPSKDLAGTFEGAKHTVKNLYSVYAQDNAGLFATATTNAKVQNLTIEKATVEGYDNVGAVVGKAAGNVSLTNVAVTESNIKTNETKKGSNIGGVVGQAVGTATLTSINVTKTNITGKYNLGGIVGLAKAANVKTSKDKIDPSFSVCDVKNAQATYYGKERDPKAGSVGIYAGKVTGQLTVDEAHSFKDKMEGKRGACGFRANFWVDNTANDGAGEWYVYYGSYNGDAGQCGSYKLGTADAITSDANSPALLENEEAIVKASAINCYIKDIIKGTSDLESELEY